MKRVLVCAVCVLAMALIACDKGGEQPPVTDPKPADVATPKKAGAAGAEPADDAKPADGATPKKAGAAGAEPADVATPKKAGAAGAEPADGAKPADAAEPAGPDPAAVEQCGKILTKCWEAAKPGFALLGVEDLDAKAEDYTSSGKNFVERCAGLTQEQRDCLEKAKNPLAGIRSCKINEGKKANEKLFAVDFKSHVKLFEPKPLDPKVAKKMLPGMRGKWVSDWTSAKIKTTWVIDAKGHVKETKVSRGKTDQREFDLVFEQTERLKVQWNESSAQPFFFYMPSKKVFYAAGNLLYAAYPMKNPKNFVVQDNWNYLISKNGKCTAVASTGETTKATCKMGKQKGKKVMTAKYQFAGELMMNGKPRVQERVYFVVGKRLVFDSLESSGKFMKK